MKNYLTSFEDYKIRRIYDEQTETWHFSVVDIIQALLQQPDYQAARNYWKVLKNRLNKEGSESVTKCNRLKLEAADGKKYLTDVASPETLLRLIQSVPSPKAEPIKLWFAKVGKFALLTDIIHREWASLKVKEHKELKGLKNQNLRDHMSEAELIFTALAELSTRQIAETMQATGMAENKVAGKKGGGIARKARRELEDHRQECRDWGEFFAAGGRGEAGGGVRVDRCRFE
jgi:hypothetical protein